MLYGLTLLTGPPRMLELRHHEGTWPALATSTVVVLLPAVVVTVQHDQRVRRA